MQNARIGVTGALVLVAITLGVAELTARIEDRLRLGVPLLSAPDRERDLVYHDALAIRGRPDGRYKQWRLNQFGFRNAAMSETPVDGCVRIMTLGASETFGLYEPPGMEYPAQLERTLDRSGACHEVVNAAIVGLSLRGIIRLWDAWGSRFGSHVVLIYPTPAFYLADRSPQYPGPPPATPLARAPWWTPRMLDRAKDRFDYPDIVQQYRVRRALTAAIEAQSPTWFFRNVPDDRLAQFKADLHVLVDRIRSNGAQAVLLTHTTAFHNPTRPDEIPALEAWRALQPKPTEQVLLDFEAATRSATLSVAASTGAAPIDLAGQMNGRREWFAGDYLHFNERGAGVVAELVAKYLRTAGIPRLQMVHAVQ
jgi:lysophospholipase L1-like esterase